MRRGETFSVIGERRTDKTVDEIAEEIEQLAHDLRGSTTNKDSLAEAIMHLAADISVTLKH